MPATLTLRLLNQVTGATVANKPVLSSVASDGLAPQKTVTLSNGSGVVSINVGNPTVAAVYLIQLPDGQFGFVPILSTDTTIDLGDINFYPQGVAADLQDITGLFALRRAQTFNAVSFLRSYLAATVTYNNTAALASTALSVTVEAGGIYDIELAVHSTSQTIGLNMDFGGTATAANFIGQWNGYKENDPAIFAAARVTAPGTDFNGGGNFDAVSVFTTFKGTIEVNTGGTFLLRGAQVSADASNTRILQGSDLILTKTN